ncbi:helix-turn-helix transcriptional regulator [Zooshikella marina]|uniref:AraC family transcriptional regulator n=1 Tax=Zooshikella ganghwensis TaxID=202772 RepID=UPI001BAF94D2|nr:helix-turn-helix transcriptional regulator [Zooshikella ganghwensis]MBU2704971.1 helix-turn-helix transcriptional regulator [Zooshikella ganghwensis]
MAWLTAQDYFNPDEFNSKVLGIASELAQHDSGKHCHDMGQLLLTQGGVIRIIMNQSLCILPPGRAAWIPPLCMHRAKIISVVGYRSVYLDTNSYPNLPRGAKIIGATPLLRAAMERIAVADFSTNWESGPYANILAVFLDEILAARSEHTLLPLPNDRRLQHLAGLSWIPQLKELAPKIGASEKTISRIFRRETGLSYQQWRQQWRLIRALELLAEGNLLSDVANRLEFSSDSSFSTFFSNMVGCSPRTYMANDYVNDFSPL